MTEMTEMTNSHGHLTEAFPRDPMIPRTAEIYPPDLGHYEFVPQIGVCVSVFVCLCGMDGRDFPCEITADEMS